MATSNTDTPPTAKAKQMVTNKNGNRFHVTPRTSQEKLKMTSNWIKEINHPERKIPIKHAHLEIFDKISRLNTCKVFSIKANDPMALAINNVFMTAIPIV